MAFDLPSLPPGGFAALSGEQGQIYWQQVTEAIEARITEIEDVLAAVVAAQAAADTAQAAADSATAAAAAAQDAAEGATGLSALQNSYVTGATITATDAGADATINITAHTRHYTDGTTVSVDGGSVTGLAYSTDYVIFYDDAARVGGAVTYQASVTESDAAQVGDRHSVGAVTTPAAAALDETGNFTKWPGYTAP